MRNKNFVRLNLRISRYERENVGAMSLWNERNESDSNTIRHLAKQKIYKNYTILKCLK